MGYSWPGSVFEQRSTKNSTARPLVVDANLFKRTWHSSRYFLIFEGWGFFRGRASLGALWRIGWVNWYGIASTASWDKVVTDNSTHFQDYWADTLTSLTSWNRHNWKVSEKSSILGKLGIRCISLHKANHVHLMRNEASVFLIVLDDDVPWHIWKEIFGNLMSDQMLINWTGRWLTFGQPWVSPHAHTCPSEK